MREIFRALRRAGYQLLERLPRSPSDLSLAHEAQKYWEDPAQTAFQSNSHWKGSGGLREEVWSELGRPHVQLLQEYMKIRGQSAPLERIIEWGCGGGANAVHFAPLAKSFVGVDVSSASLDECENVLRSVGQDNFSRLLVDVSEPEKSAEDLIATADVFLCTYVFELLPSQEYGQRILDLAYKLLRPGGFAIIQIKYQTHERRTQSRKWGYRRNLANMTTYPIDDFWRRAEAAAFTPRYVSLRPKDNLVDDERYAYFILEKTGPVVSQTVEAGETEAALQADGAVPWRRFA
jgi:SAM-dependent methyltransferase